jgi:hypothetical protein
MRFYFVMGVSLAGVVPIVVFFIAVVLHSTNREHKRQQRKDCRLNEANEQLQPVDDVHENERHQEREHQD